jgi:DNA replication ATP-dependent helicase Dna2
MKSIRNQAIQRYLITIIQEGTYKDERGRQQVEKVKTVPKSEPRALLNMYQILVVEEPKTKFPKSILLRQSWVDTPCTIGSYVHVVGSFSRTGQCIVDNSNNILILHPDHLISSTHVSDSFGCVRRAVLQDRVKSTGDANPAMLYGNVLHELLQEAMKANAWDDESLEKFMTAVLPRHYETIVEVELNLNQVHEHLRSKFQIMQGWAAEFLSGVCHNILGQLIFTKFA